MRKVKAGTVTDDQGRTRFHGAFTGGFSAGYFNTVGSAEGFKPQQFVSSRNNRSKLSQKAEDFMDEDDGLLGGKLSARRDIDSFAATPIGADSSSLAKGISSKPSIEQRVLSDLVIEPADGIGKRLLALLGWKRGQGIGPRTHRPNIHNTNVAIASVKELGIDLSSLPAKAVKDGVVTFAVNDEENRVPIPPPKLDDYGVGFDRLEAHPELREFDKSRITLQEGKDGSRKRDNIIRMDLKTGLDSSVSAVRGERTVHATTAYEDHSDDEYGITSHIGNLPGDASTLYGIEDQDMILSELQYANDQQQQTLEHLQEGVATWLDAGDGNKSVKTDQMRKRCASDNRLPLPGFHVAERDQEKPAFFPPPVVPSDFREYHSFPADANVSKVNEINGDKTYDRYTDRSIALKKRNDLLGEEQDRDPASGSALASRSVFDLFKPADRQRLQSVRQLDSKVSTSSADTNDREVGKELTDRSRPMLGNQSLLNSAFAGLSEAFKNRFTSSSSTGSTLQGGVVKEGIATAHEYKKLAAEKAQRDNPSKTKSELSSDKSQRNDLERAKNPIRTTTVWAPAALLCKRLNVKMPDFAKQASSQTSSFGTTAPVGGGVESKQIMQLGFDRSISRSATQGSNALSAAVDELQKGSANDQDVYQMDIVPVDKSIFLEESDSNSGDEVIGENGSVIVPASKSSKTIVDLNSSDVSYVQYGPQTNRTGIVDDNTLTSTGDGRNEKKRCRESVVVNEDDEVSEKADETNELRNKFTASRTERKKQIFASIGGVGFKGGRSARAANRSKKLSFLASLGHNDDNDDDINVIAESSSDYKTVQSDDICKRDIDRDEKTHEQKLSDRPPASHHSVDMSQTKPPEVAKQMPVVKTKKRAADFFFEESNFSNNTDGGDATLDDHPHEYSVKTVRTDAEKSDINRREESSSDNDSEKMEKKSHEKRKDKHRRSHDRKRRKKERKKEKSSRSHSNH